ncbi:DUF1304 domain-containing protein [Avibacterium avium]|uniref:DUF1304 domain-containing protein n=1 Tax=Avibacterium avium TaxID=751 RepID=UPI003BF8D3F1
MLILATLLLYFVAIEHFYILYLEIFAIESKSAKRIFNLEERFITQKKVKVLFANQGLYNGFLAAGLIFAQLTQNVAMIYFLLGCIIIAAIFGAATARNHSILIKQGLPAILAFIAYILS